jgi:LysR family transcriptional activator of nhaA
MNYHHLFYFWTVARLGSLRAASEELRVAISSISAQLQALEAELGTPLFRKAGRGKALTESGSLVFAYAGEIFSLGHELQAALRQQGALRAPRIHAGVTDSIPKLVAKEILQPVIKEAGACLCVTEGRMEDLMGLLASHRLDVILADREPEASQGLRVFSQLLGQCSLAFLAPEGEAAALRKGFPKSLDGRRALLPSGNTPMGRTLNSWLRRQKVTLQVAGEFDDPALAKVFAADGAGLMVLPDLATKDARRRFGLEVIASVPAMKEHYWLLSMERKVEHAVVRLIIRRARIMFAALSAPQAGKDAPE